MVGSERSIVGDLINFRGLVYAPLNENGVVFLFGKVAEDLNMYVEEIKPGFPDCIARRFVGRGWQRVRVEFEHQSSAFQQHGHDPDQCDVIICWEHDWEDCPLEVIELRDRIKEMEDRPIQRPDETEGEEKPANIQEWFEIHEVQPGPRDMFERLREFVTSLDGECFHKVGLRLVSFYCPERVFVSLFPRETKLRLNMFTGGEPLGEVTQFDFRKGAEKWGGISLSTQDELKTALPWVRQSYERIKQAIENNEPTGWHTTVEESTEEIEVSGPGENSEEEGRQ